MCFVSAPKLAVDGKCLSFIVRLMGFLHWGQQQDVVRNLNKEPLVALQPSVVSTVFDHSIFVAKAKACVVNIIQEKKISRSFLLIY